MIRITLDLPAPAAEVARFAEMVADIDAGATIAIDERPFSDALIASLGGSVEPQPEPQPEPPKTTQPKATKTKATGSDRKLASGGVRQAVLDVLALHDGRFEGSAADLAREAHPANPQSGAATIKAMLGDGAVIAERNGHRISALKLPGANTSDDAGTVSPPVPPLPEGLRKPAGGWA